MSVTADRPATGRSETDIIRAALASTDPHVAGLIARKRDAEMSGVLAMMRGDTDVMANALDELHRVYADLDAATVPAADGESR